MDLDKKNQKAETQLVQSVIEAHEKKNAERVDVLITNAVKQLKMSRFKPDQSTCYSLTYLAKICPRVFQQSATIKDLLKSLIRRDNAPTNIKGSKNDIMLPVLAANILLACCDGPEIRSLVLGKVEHWLGQQAAQKGSSEMVQHLLATVCMKAQASDPQTISTLIEMRHSWLRYLSDNHSTYGPVPRDLCVAIRKLIHQEANCASLQFYLEFLISNDKDTESLACEVSKFILERPITLASMFDDPVSGLKLQKSIMIIFNMLSSSVIGSTTPQSSPPKQLSASVTPSKSPVESAAKLPNSATKLTVPLGFSDQSEVAVKAEDIKPVEIKIEVNSSTVKMAPHSAKKEETKKDGLLRDQQPKAQEETTERLMARLYLSTPHCPRVLTMPKNTVDASLYLASCVLDTTDDIEYFDQRQLLFGFWMPDGQQSLDIFTDYGLHNPYNIPFKLRRKLILSRNDQLVDIGLKNSNSSELIQLVQTFGMTNATIDKILKKIEAIVSRENLKTQIKDMSFFSELMGYYKDLGMDRATNLLDNLVR